MDDQSATEVLFLLPDGTLEVHSSARDKADADRKEREDDFKKWVEETEKQGPAPPGAREEEGRLLTAPAGPPRSPRPVRPWAFARRRGAKTAGRRLTPGPAGSTIITNIPRRTTDSLPPAPAVVILSETRGMSQQQRRRRLEVEDSGDVAVVQFVDKKILDEQNIQMIGDDLFRLVDELGRRKILLNFGNVEFLSSAALGKLITLNRKVQAVRGKLVLCNISKEIREVFEITKLDKLFTILPDEQAALQAF